MRLRVLRRTVNEPGFAGDEFKAIRQGDVEFAADGQNVFQTSLTIRKGDFIGLRCPSDATAVKNVDGAGLFGTFDDSLVPGGPAASPGAFPSGPTYLLFNATVRG